MSFEELTAIAKENHERRTYELCTLQMPSQLRSVLREKFPPALTYGSSPSFTEAFEMSAAKYGLPFSGGLGDFIGIRIWIDDTMPENHWKLVSADGKVVKEGVVSE